MKLIILQGQASARLLGIQVSLQPNILSPRDPRTRSPIYDNHVFRFDLEGDDQRARDPSDEVE